MKLSGSSWLALERQQRILSVTTSACLTTVRGRLATLRALNATGAPPGAPVTPEPAEAIVMAEDAAPQASSVPEDQPDSIETQMDTSMTATLKALSVRPEDIPDDDEEEEKKGGFFSRFRKS